MELPIELQNLIALVISSVVVFVLTQIAKLGFDFSGYKSQIVAAIFSAVMVAVNALLAKIPLESVNLATAIANLVVVLLGAFGVFSAYKQLKRK